MDQPTTRDTYRSLWAERRRWPVGSVDHEYRTRALRRLVWLMRGKPTETWRA